MIRTSYISDSHYPRRRIAISEQVPDPGIHFWQWQGTREQSSWLLPPCGKSCEHGNTDRVCVCYQERCALKLLKTYCCQSSSSKICQVACNFVVSFGVSLLKRSPSAFIPRCFDRAARLTGALVGHSKTVCFCKGQSSAHFLLLAPTRSIFHEGPPVPVRTSVEPSYGKSILITTIQCILQTHLVLHVL